MTPNYDEKEMLYSYLNLESTKTSVYVPCLDTQLYSYLNLESTKTGPCINASSNWLYSYLNLESTKTIQTIPI